MRLVFILTVILTASNVIGQQQLRTGDSKGQIESEKIKVMNPLPVPQRTLYPAQIQNQVYKQVFGKNETNKRKPDSVGSTNSDE